MEIIEMVRSVEEQAKGIESNMAVIVALTEDKVSKVTANSISQYIVELSFKDGDWACKVVKEGKKERIVKWYTESWCQKNPDQLTPVQAANFKMMRSFRVRLHNYLKSGGVKVPKLMAKRSHKNMDTDWYRILSKQVVEITRWQADHKAALKAISFLEDHGYI